MFIHVSAPEKDEPASLDFSEDPYLKINFSSCGQNSNTLCLKETRSSEMNVAPLRHCGLIGMGGWFQRSHSKSIIGANKYTTYDINLSMILLLHNFVIFLRSGHEIRFHPPPRM